MTDGSHTAPWQSLGEPWHADVDRAYAELMVREHGDQARHHDKLRSLWAAVMTSSAAALLIASLDPSRTLAAGLLMFCVGGFCGLLIAKNQERHDLHMRLLRSFRETLSEPVRPEIAATVRRTRLAHRRERRLMQRVSPRLAYLVACVGIMATGAVLSARTLMPEPPLALASRPEAARATPELADHIVPVRHEPSGATQAR